MLGAANAMDSGAEGGDQRTQAYWEKVANLPDTPRRKVLYVAPFKASWDDIRQIRQRPELWFHLDARDTGNCKYYETQAQIAAKGYTVMGRLCNGVCPFADQCKANPGQYMHQFEEMRDYPLVFLRHPHLLMKDLSSRAELVIIDEDPHTEFLQSRELADSDLEEPRQLQELLDEDFDDQQINYVLALTEALGKTLISARHDSADVVRAGPDVLRLLDAQLQQTLYGVFDLLELCQRIDPGILDVLDRRTPAELLDPKTVHRAPSGDFAVLFRLVVEETLDHYQQVLRDVDYRWNSRLNIIKKHNGDPRRDVPVFKFFPMQPFPIPLKVPIIALDATGSPSKYERSTGRQVLDNRALVRNESTKTVVFTGSGFSITSIRNAKELSGVQAFTRADEWAVEPTLLPVAEDVELLADSPAINDAIKVLYTIADRHDSLLVVTYKSLRARLEREMWRFGWDLQRRLYWGHFRALRGSNAFNDVEAVLLIGTPRPPLRETSMAMSALFYTDPEVLDFTLGPVWVPYHATGALPPARVLTFADERLHPLVDEIEGGEMLQCLSRIRPHTSQHGKSVYLLTERPAAEWVTHLVPYKTVTTHFDVLTLAGLLQDTPTTLTIAGVRRSLDAKGIDVGERKARAVAAYLKNPLSLTSWMEDAILPVDLKGEK
jgi:hypothetical protein